RALPWGSRKLRAKPSFTLTSSPIVPVRPMRSSRMTFIWVFLVAVPFAQERLGAADHPRPQQVRQSRALLDGVGHQADEAGALDGTGQFTLLLGRNGSDAARHDLAALGNVARKQAHILVVDLW